MSSAGKQPADELADHSTAVYDTVRSPPMLRDEAPTKTAGGYVTPVGKFPAELDQHYQNIRHFKEIKRSFKSNKVGTGVGLERSTGVLAPLPPLKPALPSKGNPGSEARYQNTPRVPTKTSGYAELRTTCQSVYTASYTSVANTTQPQKRSEFDYPYLQQGSMGNAPTVQPRLKRTPPKPRSKPMDAHNQKTSRSSSGETSRSSEEDVSNTKPSQAIIEGPLAGNREHISQTRKSRQNTEFLKDIHTPDPVLDKTLRQCQAAMKRYAAQAADGRIVFTTDRFACGMFDHLGGILPLPRQNITLYVTPNAIVGNDPEPIFIYIHPDSPTDLLDLEKGDKPISPTVVCGKAGLKFSSDIVLSFPVKSQGSCAATRHQVIVSEPTSPSEKPKQQVMDKILDCFFSVDDNRCTIMVNQLGNFTVISQAPRKTESFRGRYASQPSEEFVSFRVGVFGRQAAGTGSAQIRVIFWKDTDEESQRIVAEEVRDRFRKLDRVRVVVISKYRKAVWVTASHLIPGWTLLTKDKKRLSVERIISQHQKDGCPPSCTFALYQDTEGSGSAKTSRVASCTIEVSQDGGYVDKVEEESDETVQFVAVVEEEAEGLHSTAPVIPPRKSPLPGNQMSQRVPQSQNAATVTFTMLPKPPASLRHKTLGELSLHLQVSAISGRCWKLLAQKMGLSAPRICCLRERYLCPGQALLNWYLGQQVALVPTREALRRLLDLFREMDWPELETILMREIQNTDNKDPGQDWSTTRPRVYEIIDDEANQAMKGAGDTGIAKSSPGLQRNNSYEAPERNRMPVPTPRSSPKTVIKRKEEFHQAKVDIPDPDILKSETQDAERPRKSPFNQNLHFTSSGSEKIISPASSPTGLFYQPPMTQLPKPTLWNTAHGVSQHKRSQSGAPSKREDASNSTPCQDKEKQSGFDEQPPSIPLLPPNEDTTEAAIVEENPYLKPNVKDKVRPFRTMEKPHSIRPPQKRFNREPTAPTPPQRTTSVRSRTARLQIPRGSQKIEPSTVPEIPSASNQSQHDREHQEVIYECHQVTDQTPAVEEHPQFALSLQLKKRDLKDLLKKKLLKVTGREEADPEVPLRRHSISLDGSIPESIYDDVDILLENKDLAMMQDEPDGKQLLEKILQSSAFMGLLSKIPHSTSRRKTPSFPEDLKPRAATDDMVYYEDISVPEIPVRKKSDQEADRSGVVVKKTIANVKPCAVTDEMICYEEINELEVLTRTVIPSSSGAASNKPLPPIPPPTNIQDKTLDMDCYEGISSSSVPTRIKSDKVKVKTMSGELKTVRKFVPKTRAVPPKPEETYEVMPIGQGGVEKP